MVPCDLFQRVFTDGFELKIPFNSTTYNGGDTGNRTWNLGVMNPAL